MFTISEIVTDGVLSISFIDSNQIKKSYSIKDSKGKTIKCGDISGKTQRCCINVEELKKGVYYFNVNELSAEIFRIS